METVYFSQFMLKFAIIFKEYEGVKHCGSN